MELEQNSKEWFEWRRGRICSSDVPAIMGVSEYNTAPDRDWETKNV